MKSYSFLYDSSVLLVILASLSVQPAAAQQRIPTVPQRPSTTASPTGRPTLAPPPTTTPARPTPTTTPTTVRPPVATTSPTAKPVVTSPSTSTSPAATAKPPVPLLTLPANKDQKYLLKSQRTEGSTDLVEASLEVLGEVKQITEDQKPVNDKMAVVANFRFEERTDQFSMDTTKPLSSLRKYESATAKMNIGENRKNPVLESKLKTIYCQISGGATTLFSPMGHLTSEQLLLIEGVPGNTLVLDRLLPQKSVAVGDSWPVSDNTLAAFLYIDVVGKNEVTAILTSVPEPFAIVEVVGDVEGVFLGAATDLSIQAKLQFDLHSGRITWVGLLIDEKRSIGHAGPGLDVKARYLASIQPLDEPNLLKNVDSQFPKSMSVDILSLRYEYEGRPWIFSHSREWFVTQDDTHTTIMRMLRGGELVAQCTVANRGTVSPATKPSLTTFKRDLRSGLEQMGAKFRQFATESERTNENGYEEYRVEMDGIVSDMELRWIYYLLTDRNGNQRVVVFVVEPRNFEIFADSDAVMMKSFRIQSL